MANTTASMPPTEKNYYGAPLKNKTSEFFSLSILARNRTILKINETMTVFIGCLTILVQYLIVEYLHYSGPVSFHINSSTNNLCSTNLALCLLLDFLLVYRFYIQSRIHEISELECLIDYPSPPSLSTLICEILICSICLPPYIDISFEGEMLQGTYNYHISEIILLLMTLKSYLLLRLTNHYSKWTSSKARYICNKYSTVPNSVFSIKSDLKARPFLAISFYFIAFIVILGIAVMQAERNFYGCNRGIVKMTELTNNEWMIFVTMATIGYGDIFPCTHHGRFICLVACIAGMILVSALIVALNNASLFSKDQQIAYFSLKSQQQKHLYMALAADLVKIAFRASASKSISRRFKFALLMKQKAYEFDRAVQSNKEFYITSTEMLGQLQDRMEKKLSETQRVICELPHLKKRCQRLNLRQLELDDKVKAVIEQQNFISKFIKSKFGEAE